MFISILTNMFELKKVWGKNCCKLYTAILEKHRKTGFDTCAFLVSHILAILRLCKILGTWQLRTRKNWERIVSIRPISWWFTSATLQFRGEKVSLKHENSMFEGEGIEWYIAKWRIDAIIFPWHWSKHNLFYLHPSAMEISVKDFLKHVETLRSTYPTNPRQLLIYPIPSHIQSFDGAGETERERERCTIMFFVRKRLKRTNMPSKIH